MTLQEILTGGGSLILVSMTLVQLAPIKINPWSWVAKTVRNAIYGDVSRRLDAIAANLNTHIKMDDRRNADAHRVRILHFNNELLGDKKHTKEEFLEVLAEIDEYEKYCKENPDYPNNRAVLAIEHIREVYKGRLREHDFLQESIAARHEEE